MAKLNVKGTPSGKGALGTSQVPSGLTHEGGTGYQRDAKSELFLRGTTMFAGENSFYEKAKDSDKRAVELAITVAEDDWDWITGFLPWLRTSGNIRTMPVMLAAHVVHDALDRKFAPAQGQMSLRNLVSGVIGRPDELKEMAQYWTGTFGSMPKPVKRGLADAASRMLTQRNVMRWDKPGPMMLADVVELTHPRKRLIEVTEEGVTSLIEDSVQGRLYEHLITTRQQREGYVPPESLPAIRARWELSRMDPEQRHVVAASALDGNLDARNRIFAAAAGQWEWVLPWLGEYSGGKALSKRQQWELLVPELGYMALIRNLRNLDESGIRDSLAGKLAQRISNPDEVAKSRQLPFRFLSAYLNVPSVRWSHPLEQAINLCIPNVPRLDGRTSILIDTSGSMESPISTMVSRGKRDATAKVPSRVQAAAVFGLALALRNEGSVDVWGFADSQFIVDPRTLKGASLLPSVKAFTDQVGKVGHGTQIERAVRDTYKGQDRVVILTDMQTFPSSSPYYAYPGDVTSAVPGNIHVYGFNLAGYTHSGMASGGQYRHELGGLSDHTFSLIPLLEMGAQGKYPWEMAQAAPADGEDE